MKELANRIEGRFGEEYMVMYSLNGYVWVLTKPAALGDTPVPIVGVSSYPSPLLYINETVEADNEGLLNEIRGFIDSKEAVKEERMALIFNPDHSSIEPGTAEVPAADATARTAKPNLIN